MHTRIAALVSALVLAFAPLAVHAQGAAQAAQQPVTASHAGFESAFSLFQRASGGDKDQVEPAIAAFEQLSASDPKQPLFGAYLGSALTLRGRDALMPWNKMKAAEAGLDYLDKALRQLKPEHDKESLRGVPVSLETRMLAARTFLILKDDIFHRRSQGKSLLGQVQNNPALATTPPSFQASVQITAAQLAKQENRTGDEAALLKQALAKQAAGLEADGARARLKELGQ